MRLLEFVVPGYDVPDVKVGPRKGPPRRVPDQRIAIAPEAVVAIEEPDEDGESVVVVTATRRWEVAGTFEDAIDLWLRARTEAQP